MPDVTPPPPAWIRWPIRVLAVLFVLPFRLLRHTAVPAYRMIAAGGRWVRESILRPAAGMARAVLVSAGLRR